MSLAEGDKLIMIPTRSGLVAINAPEIVDGDKVIMVPTTSGKIALKLESVSVGDKVLMIPDSSGKLIAVKLPSPVHYGIPNGTPVVSLGLTIVDMIVWNGYIYVLCDNSAIYRSNDGTTWNLAVASLEDVAEVQGFGVLGAYLYVCGCVWHAPPFIAPYHTAVVWRTNDGTTWGSHIHIISPTSNVHSLNLYTFGGYLYSFLLSYGGFGYKVYRSNDGTTWNLAWTVPESYLASFRHGMAEFDGYLYIGFYYAGFISPPADGGHIYRSSDGTTWNLVKDFFALGKIYLYSLYSFGGKLWVSIDSRVYNSSDGTTYNEVETTTGACYQMVDLTELFIGTVSTEFITSDGTTWKTETPGNTGSIVASVSFGGYIYIGTSDGNIYKRLP